MTAFTYHQSVSLYTDYWKCMDRSRLLERVCIIEEEHREDATSWTYDIMGLRLTGPLGSLMCTVGIMHRTLRLYTEVYCIIDMAEWRNERTDEEFKMSVVKLPRFKDFRIDNWDCWEKPDIDTVRRLSADLMHLESKMDKYCQMLKGSMKNRIERLEFESIERIANQNALNKGLKFLSNPENFDYRPAGKYYMNEKSLRYLFGDDLLTWQESNLTL